MPARRDLLEAGPANDLAAARAEVERLRAEVARLRGRLAEVEGEDAAEPAKDAPSVGSVTAASAPALSQPHPHERGNPRDAAEPLDSRSRGQPRDR